MPRPQRSVQREGEVTGVGLHTGADVTLRVKPAPRGTGVVFVRSDLPGAPRIPADARHLGIRERRTALVGDRDAEVHTVEHFLACCTGLGIDNLVVELDGPECPGMDGSAAAFVDLLDRLEPVSLDAPRAEVVIRDTVSATAGDGGVLTAIPDRNGFSVSYTLEYDHPYLGRQHYSLEVTPDRFREEIAPARTFCLASEAEALRAQDLGRGASYENTLVVGDEGVIENEPHWPDEFARHKLLDLLGDLFLVGADIRGHVHAYRTGHAANLALVRSLLGLDGGSGAAAVEGPARTPVMEHAQIRRILPHRYPFLLVDRVLQVEGFQRAVGVKNVTINEPFFQGHYPQEPIMPGVLIVEAMAQLAGILLLRKLELTGKVPVLLSIDRVKFRRAVIPGDQLILEAETLRLSGSRGRVRCRSLVKGDLVAESRLNFALTEASTG
ncbi:MAG: UDP-3-O-acyl-N-acetylglucosamine deacetylase [Planctomycetota bacterium]|jgi:UDP-3-O-[3-hydroxymyristoyl] N-acetylglucosamine deacetylase/3-hydroxyacyl-[acyl-carrier-protein] dehydratase